MFDPPITYLIFTVCQLGKLPFGYMTASSAWVHSSLFSFWGLDCIFQIHFIHALLKSLRCVSSETNNEPLVGATLTWRRKASSWYFTLCISGTPPLNNASSSCTDPHHLLQLSSPLLVELDLQQASGTAENVVFCLSRCNTFNHGRIDKPIHSGANNVLQVQVFPIIRVKVHTMGKVTVVFCQLPPFPGASWQQQQHGSQSLNHWSQTLHSSLW